MSVRKILIAVLATIAVICNPIRIPTYSQADENISATLSFDQPSYNTEKKFTAIIKVNNSSDKRSSRSRIYFYLGHKLDLEKDHSFPDKPPRKPLVRYFWSRAFRPGETELRLSRNIKSSRLTEGAYPAWITVVSDNKIVSTKRSALVIIDPKVVPPLAVTLLWNLNDRAHFDPDGVFLDKKIQKDCVLDANQQGTLTVYLSAHNNHPNFIANMNITPLLAQQVQSLSKRHKCKEDDEVIEVPEEADEVRNAQQILAGYRRLVRGGQIEMVPAPFSYPSLDYLAAQGWQEDFLNQIKTGRTKTREIFDLASDPAGVYIPDLKLSSQTLGYLPGSGAAYSILDETWSERFGPEIKDIYRPYRIEDSQSNRMTIFFADQEASSILSYTEDAESSVQQLLGLLATIYLEQPERQKVITIAPSADEFRPNSDLLETLYTRFEQIPWVKSTSFSVASQLISPPNKPARLPQAVTAEETVNDDYGRRLKSVRKIARQFQAMTITRHPLEKQLFDYLLIAESKVFLESKVPEQNNLGFDFLAKIEKDVRAELDKMDVADNQNITLTSSKGKIPIAINNKTPYPFKIKITVESAGLEFPDGKSQEIRLHPRENLYTVPVVTKGSAPEKIRFALHYEDYVIKEGSLIVQSMYYNFTILIILGLIIVALTLPLAWRYLRSKNPS